MKYKKQLSLDFDGVIHSYSSGCKGPRNIPDPPVAGAIEWITSFIYSHCILPESICAMQGPREWELNIFSSRSRHFGARTAMRKWLIKNGLDKKLLEVIKFPMFKPSSVVLLDDRAICFDGKFPSMDEIVKFRPWNKRK